MHGARVDRAIGNDMRNLGLRYCRASARACSRVRAARMVRCRVAVVSCCHENLPL